MIGQPPAVAPQEAPIVAGRPVLVVQPARAGAAPELPALPARRVGRQQAAEPGARGRHEEGGLLAVGVAAEPLVIGHAFEHRAPDQGRTRQERRNDRLRRKARLVVEAHPRDRVRPRAGDCGDGVVAVGDVHPRSAHDVRSVRGGVGLQDPGVIGRKAQVVVREQQPGGVSGARALVAGGGLAAVALVAVDAQARVVHAGKQVPRLVGRAVVDHDHLGNVLDREHRIEVGGQRGRAVEGGQHDRHIGLVLAPVDGRQSTSDIAAYR